MKGNRIFSREGMPEGEELRRRWRGIDQSMGAELKGRFERGQIPLPPSDQRGPPPRPDAPPLAVSVSDPLKAALRDDYGPQGRKSEEFWADPAQQRKWLLVWNLVTGADRERVEWSWRDYDANRDFLKGLIDRVEGKGGAD
jgi:hypothetical protein